MHEVKAATHPAAAAAPVPADVRQAIHEQTTRQSIARHWANRLKSLLERAKELQPSELAALAETDAILQQVISGKRVLLMSEILSSIQYPDLEVCKDLQHGFPLAGWLRPTGLWPVLHQPPLLQVETLNQLALPIRTSVLGRFRSSNDDEVAARLSQVTLQEVEDGSLLPGVPLNEVPHDVVVSPRFPVIQGPKLRAIDVP